MWKPLALMCFAGCAGVSPEVDPPASPPTDPLPVEPAPSIAEALDCRNPGITGVASGTDLQRVILDPATFPNAVCNDGSPATFYFRPSATPAGRERWVIQLQGGGGCHDPESCARRWCSVDTFLGANNMSTRSDPELGMKAEGVLERDPRNPYADANHIYVRYCSSDTHSGMSGPLDVDGHHPITGTPVRYRIHFEGRAIFDAVIASLRRDLGGPLQYTLQGPADELPDLDTASDILLAGASAGAGGVIANVDRFTATFPGRVTALIDSTLGPSGEELDWTSSEPCTANGECTWQDLIERGSSLFTRHGDSSCDVFHKGAADAYLCDDGDHVLRNHLTTPFLVRQGLRDQQLLENSVEAHPSVPGSGLMTPQLFVETLRTQLGALPDITGTAEEASAITTPPGVFGPNCADHETLSQAKPTYGVTVDGLSMFDVLANWRAGTGPAVVIASPDEASPDCN